MAGDLYLYNPAINYIKKINNNFQEKIKPIEFT